MSRRRGAPRDSWVPGVTVAVVCTGRGTHPEVSFGSVKVFPDGRTHERLKAESHHNGYDEATLTPLRTIPFVCRRCRPARNVPLKRSTLDALCAGVAESGTPRLDLSALGAIGAISS